MLNATLTVQASTPNSHEKIGWQLFTDAVIKAVNDKLEGVVFILWGAFAQKKASIVSAKKHCVLKVELISGMRIYGFIRLHILVRIAQTSSMDASHSRRQILI
jgi:uracil-DNA glycosylase